MSFEVHLIDGTYELFRHFFAVPSRKTPHGSEIGAVRGVLNSVLNLFEMGATHIAVATDSTITSFRNELWPGYKDGSDIDPLIEEQFDPLEEGLRALGIELWPMSEFEADDALAAGAAMASDDPRVSKVLICTPDKDLAQCVGGKIFQWDRRKDLLLGSQEVEEKYGVSPASIPDYLALVGDSADGFPGLSGWGQKSSSVVLNHYGSIDLIPDRYEEWDIQVRSGASLASRLASDRNLAMLFKEIATVRNDAPVSNTVDALEWSGPAVNFEGFCETNGLEALFARTEKVVADRT